MSLTPLHGPSWFELLAALCVLLCAMQKYKRISIDVDTGTPHSQHGDMNFRNHSYDLLRFTDFKD
jgi:hypothetical protein